MKIVYDTYYQTENLFGEPYPELINFFLEYPVKGNVLDLGCGQGRDSVPLARLGYTVMGIDNSKVGVKQMNHIASTENLPLTSKVANIFEFDNFGDYDFVLLDSMFHFTKKDKKKETEFIKKIVAEVKNGCILIFCIQDTGNKVKILNKTINYKRPLDQLVDKKFKYFFKDKEHQSETDYRMLVFRE